MQLNDNLKYFEEILKDFNDHGVLQDFILIGSWCLKVYKEHFNNDPSIPMVVTHDVDFLIPNPPKKGPKVNIPEILEKHGLELLTDASGSKMKFVSHEIEVEFLYVDKGAGESSSKRIDNLKIVATPLRYMNFIQLYSTQMHYKGIPVTVPIPEVFVLMKYLVTIERTGIYAEKIPKDIKTARDMEFFLLDQGAQENFRRYFEAMPKPWKKKLMNVLRKHESELVNVLV